MPDAQKPAAANTSAGNITPPAGPPLATRPVEAEKEVAPVARVAVHRQDLLSIQELREETKDPNRHYRWVRTVAKDDDGSISVRQKQQLGYEIEHEKPNGVRTVAKPDSTSDGSIRMGDLVLMSCPKVLRQEREKENLHFNEARLGANSETFKSRTQGQRGAKIIGEEHEERE